MFTDPNRIRRKDPGNPDICNLFQFHRLFSDAETIERVDRECRAAQIGCVEDKKLLAEIMIEALRPIRERREEIDRDPSIVWDALRRGNAVARERVGRDAGARPAGDEARLRSVPVMNDPTPNPEAEPLEIEPLESPLDAAEELEESYHVTLPAFEGPLDLLLHLIHKHKVDVYDIPILLITQQYNEYLDAMQDLTLDVAADYIYMAALLIHIKSKMLLPRDEEGEPQEDPRAELVNRLLEYQRFKAAAETFAELDVVRMGVWARPPAPLPGTDAKEIDMSEVSLFDLVDAFRVALTRFRYQHPGSIQLKRPAYKVSEKMRDLHEKLRETTPIRLFWYLEGRDRNELVVIFLATLELVRLGGLSLRQGDLFGEILLHRTEREIDPAQFSAYDH